MANLSYFLFLSIYFAIGALSAAQSRKSTVSYIVPGAVWYDIDGVQIDAHGGQVWQQGDTFYWIGSSYADSYQPRMYTSTDLLNWVNQGIQYPIINMFRPKIIQGSNYYYIIGQVSNEAQELYSSTIVGGYAEGSAYTLPPDARTYTDEGVFFDDGDWYFLASAGSNNFQLNYINGDGSIGDRVVDLEGAYEAPGMFEADGVYYLIMSSKTGYTANPNKVWWATSLSGPYTGPADIAPEDTDTYGSQNSAELVITGSETTTYIFLGDAWVGDGTANSTYMWLPMSVDTSGHTVTLDYYSMWTIDVDTGVVSVPSTGKRYEAEHSKITGRAAVTDCESCISKRAVQNIDNASEVIFKEVHGTGAAQWISIHYTTNNPHTGDAHIYINDDKEPRKISDYNTRAGFHKTIPIRVALNEGPVNTVRFGCSGSEDFEIHLDGIEVHEH